MSVCVLYLQTAPVHWCGPDGSVVLIRAVRSGLDRVVLELLRAGVPVNNTDHTGTTGLILIVFLHSRPGVYLRVNRQ